MNGARLPAFTTPTTDRQTYRRPALAVVANGPFQETTAVPGGVVLGGNDSDTAMATPGLATAPSP
eukprot:721180-Lingulodinium_polyedra.AAC.1